MKQIFMADYWKYYCMYYADRVFRPYGLIRGPDFRWREDIEIINRWKQGNTGMPYIDALMRELNATGYMPGIGRRAVASYLVRDLKQDWRYGAAYFEEKLIDHDVHSNYGNWNEYSGIGPSQSAELNSLNQARDFDANGDYIKTWCPELTDLPLQYLHEPWTMPAAIQVQVGVAITQKHYPRAIDCMKYTSKDHYMFDSMEGRRETQAMKKIPQYELETKPE